MDTDDIGIRYMRDEIFAYVAGLPGVSASPDPTWAAYIFGQKFADHRHERTLFRSQRRSVLSTLFELLSDEERGRIFTGVFDIGNGREVPRDFQTYAALERELGNQPGSGDSVLKPIKRAVQDLLGVPVKQYFEINPSITLKVLRLLYRYQRRTPQLFSFLKMPGSKRPSFEFNDAHAVREATDKQRLIDELTVHLGSELGAEQREEIRSTFMGLTYDVGVAEDRLKLGLKLSARGNIECYRRACAEALGRLDYLRRCYSRREKAQRLDVDLLIYLYRAQVENRNQAHVEVVNAVSKTNLYVKSIEDEIIRFNANFDKKSRGCAINTPIVHISEIEAFLDYWAVDLRRVISKAFDAQITDQQYKTAQANAQKIIKADQEFTLEVSISLLDVVALLCVAHASSEYPSSFRYAPYWHGQSKQSDRPFYPLSRPKPIEWKDLPEGMVIYWRQCNFRIKLALVNQLPYWNLELQITNCINAALSRVMAAHDLDTMQDFLCALVTVAENAC